MPNAVEFTMRIFPYNETLQEELKKLEAEGWQAIPNLTPAISYVMWRNIQQPEAQPPLAPQEEAAAPVAAGFGSLSIDDSKVHIYRNGRIVGE